jgi:hypothetical protein
VVRVSLDGSVQALFDQRYEHLRNVAVSADGKTIYASVSTGQVRRALVVNYGDRPRPP